MRRMRLKMRFLRLPVYVLAALVAVASVAYGEVTRVDVTSRTPVGTSGYEKIVGIAHFAVDPKDPHNRVIADIDKAPVNASRSASNFRPTSSFFARSTPRNPTAWRSSTSSNRGRKTILTSFNRGAAADPATDADLGDGFLTRQGYTLVWVGVGVRRRAPGHGQQHGARRPRCAGRDGIVRGDFTPNDASPEQTVTDLAGYSPAQPDATDTTLTVRDGPFGRPEIIDRSRFTREGATS